jgi:hypothetical protein
MAGGLTASLTAQQYQLQQGTLCATFMAILDQIDELKAFNDAQGAAGLAALPAAAGNTQITTGDANTMISAVANMKSVADGARNVLLAQADYTVFVKQCIGTGLR